jgi:hypothetical protein
MFRLLAIFDFFPHLSQRGGRNIVGVLGANRQGVLRAKKRGAAAR